MIEQVIMRAGMLWFTTIVTALGDISYAAHMVAMNIQQLSFTTGMAFGTAATTLTGQCLGRKRADLAKIYVRMTQNMGYVVSCVIAVILFTCGNFLAGMYSTEIIIISLAADMLKIIALANPISNARFVYVSALRGAGDARFMAIITFVGVLLVRPLVSILLINMFDMGLTGAWIALVSDGIICYAISMLRYRGGKWTLINI
jgi:Na+-driven multidrug efflux pump